MEFDEEKGLEYFQRMKESISETYVEKYGYDKEEADRIACRIAAKLLIRNIGQENAGKVIGLAKKRGIWIE